MARIDQGNNKPVEPPASFELIEDAQLQVPANAHPAGVTAIAPPMLTPREETFAENIASQEEFVEVPEYDTTKDEWITKKVPLAEINARNMLDVEWEGVNPDILSTAMYDQNYHYYWVNKDTSQGSYNEARVKRYAPVRKSENYAHMVRKVEGFGDVVNVGDLVLFRVPAELHNQQMQRHIEKRRKEQEEVNNPYRSEIMNRADPEANFKEGRITVRESYRRDIENAVGMADQDRAMALAESLERAHQVAGTRQSSTFGGFAGEMGSGVPESPINRKG